MSVNLPTWLRLLRLGAISALALVFFAALTRLERFVPISLPSILELLAWPLLLSGLALVLTAAVSLLIFGRTTGGPGDPTSSLVIRGPYRHIRNPVYLGGFLIFAGLGLLRPSLPYLILALLYLPLMHLYVLRVEEPATERRLGDAYRAYRLSVPRWFPRLWHQRAKT